MRHKITDDGILLPRDWFGEVTEVDIRRESDRVVVTPISSEDPILLLGQSPLDAGPADASEGHDQYLYGK